MGWKFFSAMHFSAEDECTIAHFLSFTKHKPTNIGWIALELQVGQFSLDQ